MPSRHEDAVTFSDAACLSLEYGNRELGWMFLFFAGRVALEHEINLRLGDFDETMDQIPELA